MKNSLAHDQDFEFIKANLSSEVIASIEDIIGGNNASDSNDDIYSLVTDWSSDKITAEQMVAGVLSLSNSENCILDKFDSIEIKNNSRLSAEDVAFCKRQQLLYEQVLAHYIEMKTRLAALTQFDSDFYNGIAEDNTYYSCDYKYQVYSYEFFKFDEDDFLKLIMSVHDSFVKKINWYFREKYKISITDKDSKFYFEFKEPIEPQIPFGYYNATEEERAEYERANEEYRRSYEKYIANIVSTKLHYDGVLDDIFLLLGAYSFAEQADKEIKNDVLSAVLRSNGSTIYTIKSKKISFDILRSYKCSIFKKYEVSLDSDGYRALLRALTYFDSDKRNASIYSGWASNFVHYKKSEDDGIYETHDVAGNKVISFKFFKNGKFEVEFLDHKTALEFACEFLGYREG